MNLFALTDAANSRILRLPLNNAVQSSLQGVFAQQLASFNEGITDRVRFDGRYRPDPDELLFIDDFVDIDGLADAVASPLGIDQFDQNRHNLSDIKALFAGDSSQPGRVLIQLFERRRVIDKASTLFLSGNTFNRVESNGIVLDTKLLAVLEGRHLTFQSFHFVRRVFALSDFFREATAVEVMQFAQHEALYSEDPVAFEESANNIVRSKIGLILQSGVLSRHSPQVLADTARTFKVDIALTADGKIQLPDTQKELRRLLRFLDEDFYESPLSRTHFISNSKRVAD